MNPPEQTKDPEVNSPSSRPDRNQLICGTRWKHGIEGRGLLECEKEAARAKLKAKIIIRTRLAELTRAGENAMLQQQYHKAVHCFYKAIIIQPQLCQLYVSEAEAYLRLCDFQSALCSYKRASQLQPESFNDRIAFIYYFQSQCFFDQGLFIEAETALEHAETIKPECRTYKLRRLVCMAAAGHREECLKLLSEQIVENPTGDLYLFRARIHRDLNQINLCLENVKTALALSPGQPDAEQLLQELEDASEEARQQAVKMTLCGQLQEALCLVNISLQLKPFNGGLYLFRGTLFRRLQNFPDAIDNLVHAVGLREEGKEGDSLVQEAETQMVLTYNDFAVDCYNRGLYAEATLLLNKAIDERKDLAGLYLNRGDCFFKQQDWLYALADYQQAEEMMKPNEPTVRLRLALIHNTLAAFSFQEGQFKEAAVMYNLAIQYNPTASLYYENRSKTRRKLADLSGAREDLIRLLFLDPNNDEAVPMLMNMFPGCSVSDVLASPRGQAIKKQLEETVKSLGSSLCSRESEIQRTLENQTPEET